MNKREQQGRVLRSAIEDLLDWDGVTDSDFLFGEARDLGFNVDRHFILAESKREFKLLSKAYFALRQKVFWERRAYWITIFILFVCLLIK